MSDKAARKKQLILNKAKKVFSEKGFKDVTMKDIVEATEISRGGLYIYFDSTEKILEELIRLESSEPDDVFANSYKRSSTAGDILALFLKEQKKELLEKDNMAVAMYEYLFMKKMRGDADTKVNNRFTSVVEIISHLIENGVENGEFYCEDPMGAARNIMYVIEGLKIASKTYTITENEIDQELVYLMSSLIAED